MLNSCRISFPNEELIIMIRKGNELRVAALIRQKIIDTYKAIDDAGLDRFNDRSPNWLTKQKLEALISEFGNALCSVGAIPIKVHSPCGASHHEDTEYWRWALSDGRTDEELLIDGKIVVDGQIMETSFGSIPFFDSDESREPCPCNPGKRADEHRIVEFFIWPQDSDSKIRNLVKLLPHLADAVDEAQDRKTRSAIREQLLLALIDLERLIVNVTADEEIERRRKAP